MHVGTYTLEEAIVVTWFQIQNLKKISRNNSCCLVVYPSFYNPITCNIQLQTTLYFSTALHAMFLYNDITSEETGILQCDHNCTIPSLRKVFDVSGPL